MIPRRLFKYQAINQLSLDNLSQSVIWFSAPSRFNDPFDCALQVVRAEDIDPDRAWELMRPRCQDIPGFEEVAIADGRPSEEFLGAVRRAAVAAFKQARDDTLENRGIACLSASGDDLLMWSHYSDGHRGMCLEFETALGPFSTAREVVYSAEIPRIDPLSVVGPGPMEEILEAMMLTKSDCWSYEVEWRLLHRDAATGYPYPPAALTGVYLGASTSDDDIVRVAERLGHSKAALYRMRMATDRFALTPVRLVG